MTSSALSTPVDELVAAIRTAIDDRGDWAATAASVGAAVGEHLPTPSIADGPNQLLHVEPDGSFSVLALVWRPHQWTAIHDHVTWCVFATIEGEPVEELFTLGDGFLVPAGRQALPAGTVSGETPPGDIHRVGNPHARPAISIVVYGTDISRIGSSVRRTYDLPIAELSSR
jgi:predicted metal-dependent enzyme (double-stranded beta helix superfamily)